MVRTSRVQNTPFGVQLRCFSCIARISSSGRIKNLIKKRFKFSYRGLRHGSHGHHLAHECVRVFPQSRGEELNCPLHLYSEGRASLTPPCATSWLSVLYISTHQSCDFRYIFCIISHTQFQFLAIYWMNITKSYLHDHVQKGD